MKHRLELLNKYGFLGFLKLIFEVLISKMYIKNSRIIRRPFDLRGKRHIKIGKGFTTGRNCRVEVTPKEGVSGICLKIGENFQMNDFCHIAVAEKIEIGKNVLIASKVFITDLNHGNYASSAAQDSPESIPSERKLFTKSVIIEDNVWIGESVTILPGAHIGCGSIIGANSLVSGRIPSGCIAIGLPAKVVKKYNRSSSFWEKI
jgi:acetyltransferase-like isoleucine patch superfamily enzyme